ncbi:MAG: LacI family DNA-binding transcriptional regulator [Patulibacter sp.]
MAPVTEPARPKRVGIREVAAAAGVSVTTVSHALNGKGRLPESTRDAVRDVARRLGYRPNLSAQRLVGGRTGLLGLTLAHPGSGTPATLTDIAYFVQLLTAASTTALARRYALVLSTGVGDSDDEVWQQTSLDGAVVVDPVADDPTVTALRAAGTPVVTTGRLPVQPGAEESEPIWVDNDHVDGTRRLLTHLERAGARRISLITAPLLTSYAIDLHRTYQAWCHERGVEPDVVIAQDDLGERAGFAAAEQLLERGRPDAILGALDRLAVGAQLAAKARGLSIPDDILIAGYTDAPAHLHAEPSLTALQLHPAEIGRRAVELLIALVEDEPIAERHVVVPTQLLPRGSTRRRR